MENREDLRSILPFIPLVLQSSSLSWPSQTLESLKTLSKCPLHSNVNSGETFFLAISDLRESLSPSDEESLAYSTSQGYTLFFDKLMSGVDSKKWFEEIVPSLASLLLRLPSLLEAHYESADKLMSAGVKTGLRVLESQEAGVVFLSQRKVLPEKEDHHCVSYPNSLFWSKSTASLSSFEISHTGLIEDQLKEALQVDFANKFLGGGALKKGCVQEEIRFMINPELIIGRLFLPCMADNEAIEIVGAERFSNFTGYASTFRFSGDYLDKKPVDCMGRRKTRIIAIDALRKPEMR